MPRKKSIPKPEPPKRKDTDVSVPSPPAEYKSGFKESISETKPMEVHHHPEIEKKTFKEYLLEGLMIFIAVMMGFIAENVREDYTEHKKRMLTLLQWQKM